MAAYFDYLREVVTKFFEHLVTFLYKGFVSPWTDVGDNFAVYNSLLDAHKDQFGFWGWFFFVLFLIFLIGLIAGLGFLIYLV